MVVSSCTKYSISPILNKAHNELEEHKKFPILICLANQSELTLTSIYETNLFPLLASHLLPIEHPSSC